jgi:hypothetical protein
MIRICIGEFRRHKHQTIAVTVEMGVNWKVMGTIQPKRNKLATHQTLPWNDWGQESLWNCPKTYFEPLRHSFLSVSES